MDNEHIDALSLDTAAAEQEKLRAVFPQCFVEGKLDERKLFALLGSFETLDENDRERYEFRWKGKQDCLQLAGKRSEATLRPCRAESVDWENTRNLYIEGDNLEVLKLLQTAYYRKVKMIYIDPPYNTGNDFVYADDFADPLARYKEVTAQTTKSNPETMGRFHTNWLNMMYPRLQLASNLLRDDGFIFISIDDGEQANLKKMLDEVFGEENFVCQFIWHSRQNPDSRSLNGASSDHEYVMCYSKYNDSRLLGKAISTDKYINPDNDQRGPWMSSPMDGLATAELRPNLHYTIVNPETNKEYYPNPANGWRFQRSTVATLIEEKRIIWPKNDDSKPRFKRYMNELNSQFTGYSTFLDVDFTQTGTKELRSLMGMETLKFPKPVSLVKALIHQTTAENDIVMDFFSGSATTAHAVMQLNAEDGGDRRFILVQLPEVTDEKSEASKAGYANICEIGKERIRRVGAKIKADSPLTTGELDTGFRVFKLDSSNLKLWDNSPIMGENALAELEARIYGMLDILKSDRSDEDVVYEVMLKLGQDLCEAIIVIDLPRDRRVYGVGADVTFIVCIARDVTIDDAQLMAEYAPGRIVFADACFNNSTDKSNVKLCLRDKDIAIRVL